MNFVVCKKLQLKRLNLNTHLCAEKATVAYKVKFETVAAVTESRGKIAGI